MSFNLSKVAVFATTLTFFSCNQSPEMPLNSESPTLHGYGGNQMEKWDFGQQSAADLWLQWGKYLTDENLEGILSIAGDSITIEVSSEDVINGKEELAQRLSAWFASSDVNFIPEWGVPIVYHDSPENPGDGTWVVNGYRLESRSGDTLTSFTRHSNVLVADGKVVFHRIYTHGKTVEAVAEVDFAVDMTNYAGEPYESVNIYGTFNNWCLECDSLTDEDGDGIYNGTIRTGSGELEYKFALDNDVERQEIFESGMPCTKTTGQYTNRLAEIDGSTDLGVLCFESCDCP